MGTQVALKSHKQRVETWLQTCSQKTWDLTWTRGVGLVNNLRFIKLLFLIFISLILMYEGWWQAERNVASRTRAATDIKTTVTMATSSSSGTVPYVATFGYKAFTQTANKRTATCKVCGIRINDAELHQAPENAQGQVSLSIMWKGNLVCIDS